MTYGGAGGRTAEQMADVLHLSGLDGDVHAALGKLTASLNAPAEADYKLSVANALWGQSGYRFRREFVELLDERYAAPLNEVDFKAALQQACDRINTWVADKTAGKITKLVDARAMPPSTRLVLTNAIYFKGAWRHPFDAKHTEPAPFKLAGGKQVDVPMMRQKRRFGLFENVEFQVLAMPYGKAGELEMLVMLPRATDGLLRFERCLTLDELGDWLDNMRSREVIVWLPRTKITGEFQLGRTLAKMGMPDAFSADRADFSRMTEQEKLFIGMVVHKAYVDVNEEGTEAAAATGVGMAATAMPKPPARFVADHPFMFLIRDTRSNALLFIGRVMNPAE